MTFANEGTGVIVCKLSSAWRKCLFTYDPLLYDGSYTIIYFGFGYYVEK